VAVAHLASIRPAEPADLPAIQAIYAHHVLQGLASFEEEPPSVDELARRFREVVQKGLPYLVAQYGYEVAGYGYCSPYRARSAYRYALEDSIYIRHDMAGRGIGRRLLEELIRRSEALGYRQIIAVIGDSGNAASIAVHAACGFLRVGTLRSVGFKFGRWVDSVYMQRPLGTGDGTRPENRGQTPTGRIGV
jgi:phosphinothricin acetyltransferase